jgi:hypothetical protein
MVARFALSGARDEPRDDSARAEPSLFRVSESIGEADTAQMIDAFADRGFKVRLAVDFYRGEAGVANLVECPTDSHEVDVSGAERSAVTFAQVNLTQRFAAIEDRIGQRLFFDVEVNRVDHRPNRWRADRRNQRLHFRDRVIKSHLKMIHWLDDEVHVPSAGCRRNLFETFGDAAIGNVRIGLIPPEALEQTYDKNGVEPRGDADVPDQPFDSPPANRRVSRVQAQSIGVRFSCQKGRDRQSDLPNHAIQFGRPDPERPMLGAADFNVHAATCSSVVASGRTRPETARGLAHTCDAQPGEEPPRASGASSCPSQAFFPLR